MARIKGTMLLRVSGQSNLLFRLQIAQDYSRGQGGSLIRNRPARLP
jgi:hypothetical protein